MDNSLESIERIQKYFLATLSALVVLGVVMVYSSSYIYARDIYNNPSHYFYRQLMFLSFSLPLAWVISKTKVSFWLKYGWFFHGGVILLLIGTLVPGLGNTVKGANRWINFGSFGIQPGELIKYTSLLIAVPFFENFYKYEVKERCIRGALLAFPCIPLLFQPDFGTFTILFTLIATVCFLSSFPRKIFYSALAVGVVTIIPILVSQPYRVRRLFSYLDPWKNPQTSGFQIIQSYLAFANGSIFGTGLGNSNEKLFYLPEAHNDFIFSVIGEELGFLGVFLVVALFMLLIFFGFRLASKIESRVTSIFATAIVFTIGLQASLNMGVVLGLLPTKGLNLPFVSAGGSSLIANFFAVGLFLSAVVAQKKKTQTFSNLNDFQTSSNSYINSASESDRLQGELF